MGKDVDDCCEACRLFAGDAPAVLPSPRAPLLAERAQLKLTWTEHGEERSMTPTGSEIVVGRAKTSDVVLASGAISRRQCRFVLDGGQVFLEDLHSSCGTYLDGHKISRAEVRDGSVVHVGDYALRITSTRAR
jgi:predicted component of type VI protein secretion system